MTIQILSDETINKIAAGEVVEDPSSVVKELVDNALDAGASFIKVFICHGGFTEIKVSDNGEGMTEPEAKLSIKRYATKKIRSSEDLLSIQTMGFRGEALAAIAAISKLQITTSQKELGTDLYFQGAKFMNSRPWARGRGSSFKVQDLFFNTPARKKFQKSVSVSTSKIIELMATLILCHPMVGFSLDIEKKNQFHHVPGKDFAISLKRAIQTVSRHDFYQGMQEISLKKGDFFIQGYLGSVSLASKVRKGQYLFINQRPVKCNFLSDTISCSYSTRIASTEHIPFVVFIDLPRPLVDINVDPKKATVRFSDPSSIQSFVSRAVHTTLEKREGVASALHFAPKEPFFSENLPNYTQNFDFQSRYFSSMNILLLKIEYKKRWIQMLLRISRIMY